MQRIDPQRPNGDGSIRVRYTFRGTIQGVGFRPTIYRCASSLGLAGYVQNRRSEVVSEIEGPREAVAEFEPLLLRLLPAAARLEAARKEQVDPIGQRDFVIRDSAPSDYTFPPIPPDLAICADCGRELLDPEDRRYLYPFITCTQCGPRYSIVERTPFDRETTSMIDFPQCAECLGEYSDPNDRRFHSQTNSCPACGPRLRLTSREGTILEGDPVECTVEALNSGRIVAVQGIGGFHLAANPARVDAVRRLRNDKERERKPFALMMPSVDAVRRFCRIGPDDEVLLSSAESPILILPARHGVPSYLEGVSDVGTYGVMVPYTPLHCLLFHHPRKAPDYPCLVMTSGNLRGEPIVTDVSTARSKLAHVADLFLSHDRRIVFRTDDSVLRRAEPRRVFALRRSRGYVPRLLRLKEHRRKAALGVGSDLKNAPALALDNDVYLAPFIGDLEDPATYDDFNRQIGQMLSLYAVEPEVVLHDLHPLYESTRWAISSSVRRKVAVQHHHAHILSVMAEHDLDEALGLAFDGTGYGSDGTIWGGEFLHATRSDFARLGCFDPFLLPGGEKAIKHPWRIAAAVLARRTNRDRIHEVLSEYGHRNPEELNLVLEMIEKRLNVTTTSSLGRLFDAASSLLGLVDAVSYEGEAAIRLEGSALDEVRDGGVSADSDDLSGMVACVRAPDGRDLFLLQLDGLFSLLAERPVRYSVGYLALLFHRAVAHASLQGALRMRDRTAVSTVALSGGVFQNALLRRLLIPRLEEAEFSVFVNDSVPPGDGGIAVGQVYYDYRE